MTFCTQCGTDNDDSRKYCRECGKRLQLPEPEAEIPIPVLQPAASDEAAAGEVLYEGFQLYEVGDYDGAVQKCHDVMSINPRSGSAHALLSMIYEKRGEMAESEGNTQDANDLYLQALHARERVLKLNPGSVVDAHKLKELKKKVHGEAKRLPDIGPVVERLKKELNRIPLPVLASVCVVVVVFGITFTLLSGGGKKHPDSNIIVEGRTQPQGVVQQQPVQQYPGAYTQQAPASDDNAGDGDLQFLAPQASKKRASGRTAGTPSPVTTGSTTPVPRMAPPTVRLPSIPAPPAGIQVIPLDKNKSSREQKPQQQARPVQPSSAPPKADIVITPAEKTGSDYQRDAMRLMSEGRTDEAAQNFKRAIDAYSNEVSSGINPEAANAGIRTCRTYLQSLN